MSLAEKSFEPGAPCPLDGIRVIDLSRLVAGNAVSSQLADFGAEILKIEDPQKGDPLRAWQTNGVSVHWKLYARNKKSVALSFRDPRGRELLLDLAASSEVLIENFRPGTLEKMGLAPAVLHQRNPRLVIVRVSGWGQDGPYRDRPGFGTLVESVSGYAARTGFADGRPSDGSRPRHCSFSHIQRAGLLPVAKFNRGTRGNSSKGVVAGQSESRNWRQGIHFVQHGHRLFYAAALQVGVLEIVHGMEALIAGFTALRSRFGRGG